VPARLPDGGRTLFIEAPALADGYTLERGGTAYFPRGERHDRFSRRPEARGGRWPGLGASRAVPGSVQPPRSPVAGRPWNTGLWPRS